MILNVIDFGMTIAFCVSFTFPFYKNLHLLWHLSKEA